MPIDTIYKKLTETKKLKRILDTMESLLSIVVIVGMFIFFISTVSFYLAADWTDIQAFYDFVNYILALVVGIELAKLLITHDVYSITTLLTFVIARKLLVPDLKAVDAFWAILSFGILFVLILVGDWHRKKNKNINGLKKKV